uniref:Uncharacterized protein n=1 Tax=Sphaerodactylus townsendi TaxID=933632 RepID=A0ACB8G8J1_9SAUR
MSRRVKDEYQRHYTVTDTRTHLKGYTEYKVTARFVSKLNPEDAKEIVVWKRYSDFKKLHGDLAYTHRNLFRRLEDFPPFPKAQVFGRFEPKLKEFFRGGEGGRPLENCDQPSLAPPLIPVPPEGVEPGEDALVSEVDHGILGLESEQDHSRASQAAREVCDQEPQRKEGGDHSSPRNCEDEALDALFACHVEEEREEKEEGNLGAASSSPARASLEDAPAPSPPGAGILLPAQEGAVTEDPGAYLALATEHIKHALESEAAEDYEGAFHGYHSGVDLLLHGLQGDPDAARREAVKKKTAEYLRRAEEICQQHLSHLHL